MNANEIIVGHRVLAQTGEFVKEIIKVKGFNYENGKVIAIMSDGRFGEIEPKYIIKSFGEL